MVFGGHGDASLPELAEVWVAGDGGGVLGVDVKDVDEARAGIVCVGALRCDAAEKAAQGRCLEGVEEEEEERASGQQGGEGVGLKQADRGE